MGTLITISTILAYHIGYMYGDTMASTMAFSTLCLARLFHCVNCRGKEPVNVLGFKSNPFSIIAFGAGVVFLAAVMLITPIHGLFGVTMLHGWMFGAMAILAIAPTILIQIAKNIAYLVNKKKA